MTTPHQTPGPDEAAYEIGSDWNQDMTEQGVKDWARAQAMDGFGTAWSGTFDLFGGIRASIAAIILGMFNTWFGGDAGVGDPQEVEYTIQAIKDAIINGYIVHTVVWDEVWERPDDLVEITVIGIGGGRPGSDGASGGGGGAGGGSGGYIAQSFDPDDIPSTVNITIGGPGEPTTFGSLLEVNGGAGGIASQFGYTPTNSTPGRGGNGGNGVLEGSIATTSPNGEPGEGSAVGAGGTAGVGNSGSNGNGGPGGAGGNVSAAATTKCGGGGGGGGAGGPIASFITGTRFGGAGGPGGYPGGGGGGGGGRGAAGPGTSTGAGAGGPGADGVLWIYYKIATLPVPEEGP